MVYYKGKLFKHKIKRLPENRNISLGATMQPSRQDRKVARAWGLQSSLHPEGSLAVNVPSVFLGRL